MDFFLVHMIATHHCAKDQLAWLDVVQIRAPYCWSSNTSKWSEVRMGGRLGKVEKFALFTAVVTVLKLCRFKSSKID